MVIVMGYESVVGKAIVMELVLDNWMERLMVNE